MSPLEQALAEECDRMGLPHDLPTLIRHLENNHAAALGAERSRVRLWRQRALDAGYTGPGAPRAAE